MFLKFKNKNIFKIFVAVGRTLIPRFYRTIFDSGVCELYYVVRTTAVERINPQQWGLCALDCDNVLMVTRHDRPIQAEV